MRSFRPMRGLTLIDVIVGATLVVIVFAGLFGILRASLKVSGLSKLKATATSIATSQMEYMRSLPYDSIGTLGGIPSGTIPQYASTTNGGLPFDMRTYIAYADDPADGVGAADSNGITTDYKLLKVVVSYTVDGTARDVTLVSNAAPKGIESTTGGGTLLANIVDSVGAVVSGATVRIQNTAVSPAIDLTTFSDAYGTVNLPGAPTSTEYQITVSKTGYSSASTYPRDATNVNPTPGYLTVVAGVTTASTFAIDLLGTLIVKTFSPITPDSFTDTFTDLTKLTSTTNVQATGGSLTLSGLPGSYPASGSALATTTAPLYLASWTSADATITTDGSTVALFSITDGAGTLIPDAVIPGNTTGFSAVVDLSSVSTTTYPALRLKATLTTSDPNSTPQILDWDIAYEAGPTPLPDVSFTLTGAKTKGSEVDGTPIYKTIVATTTDATGIRSLPLEWDSYSLSIPGHTIVSSDPPTPYELLPGNTVTALLILTTP